MLKKRFAFKYRAKKQNGELIESLIYAFDKEEAAVKLREMNCIPELIEEAAGSDRRLFERAFVALEVEFKFIGRPSGTVKSGLTALFVPEFSGVSRNISAGGMLFDTGKNLSVGSMLNIMLDFSESREKLFCVGRVLRCREIERGNFETAVCFVEISPEALRMIDEKVRKFGRDFDRRAYERLNESILLQAGFYKEDHTAAPAEDNAVFKATAVNVSAGGLLLNSPIDLRPGLNIEVSIRFPDDKRVVQCLAKVVRSDKAEGVFLVALFFLNLSNEERNWLNKYVIERMQQ